MKRSAFVYILASRKNGSLYVGVTTDLAGRIEDHRSGRGSTFTSKYKVSRLVWFEEHSWIAQAITREKTIKKWRRQWKINAIEVENPDWQDLRWQLI